MKVRSLHILLSFILPFVLLAEKEPLVLDKSIGAVESILLSDNFVNNILEASQLFTNDGDGFKPLLLDVSPSFQLIDSTNPYGFLDDMADLTNTYTNQETSLLNKARATLQTIQTGARFVQTLDGSTIVDLPIGIQKTVGQAIVTIGISSIRVYPTHSVLEVFAKLERPDWPLPLVFYAPEIAFSIEGGLSGISSLGLLGNIAIPLEDGKAMVLLNRAEYDPIQKSFIGGTYLQFGCDGFEGVGIRGSLIFSREWVVPIQIDGSIHPTARVSAALDLEVADLDNMIFDISIDEFVIPSADRVSWQVSNAIFDFSETEKRFNFPIGESNYDPTVNGDGFLPNNESWKGVFVSTFGIRWLDTLADNTKTSLPGLSGYDILIDHNGFTGFVQVEGLLPIEDGSIDGWDFSIDQLGVDILMNQPGYFEFNGELIIPLLKKSEENPNSDHIERIAYGGDFDFTERRYGLMVGLAQDKVFDINMFKAEATVYESSQLRLEYREDEGFGIEAIIHGSFSINSAKIAGKTLDLPPVEFEGLHIASQKDYIRKIGVWGLPSDVTGSFLGFGYNVDLIEIQGAGEDAEFRVSASLNFGQESSSAESNDGMYISAGGAFRLQGNIEFDNQIMRQRYRYKTLKVDMLQIEADLPAVYFNGQIIFYRDVAGWGTGFQGKLDIFVTGANKSTGDQQEPNLGISALALFGTNQDNPDDPYRYFMIDMLARLGSGITIPSTGLKLKGIGGGIYYHMDQLSVTENIQDKTFDPGDPSSNPDAYTAWMLDNIGKSLSGTEYLPDKSKLFGVNATIVFSAEKEEAFNANVTFTLQVNSNFSIDFVRIKGVTNFMAPVSWTGPSCTGVSVATEMNLIFPNSEGIEPGFSVNAHTFTNIKAGSKSLLFGDELLGNAPPSYVNQMKKVCPVSEIRYAGAMEAALTASEWYLNMGVPDQRLKLRADFYVASAALAAYIDIGTNVPPFPGLPDNVASLTNFTAPTGAQRASGNGFAYGAAFNLDLLDINFALIIAQLQLGAGFDLMIKQYAPTYCENTGEEQGVFNWYAKGQAYAYIQALLEIAGFNIGQFGAAALLQFEGPKPSYGRGAFTTSYKRFRNKQGHVYLPFEFGEKCITADQPSTPVYQLIADLSPADETQSIAVNQEIVAAFNYPVDEVFTDYDEAGNPIQFKLIIDTFVLLDNQQQVVPSTMIESPYTYRIQPNELLDATSNYSAHLAVRFIDLSDGSTVHTETQVHEFTSYFSLAQIPEDNIDYTYPFNGQYNYYLGAPSESARLELKRGQEELFQATNSLYYAKFTSSYPAYQSLQSVYYNNNSQRLLFNLPEDLIPGQAYRMQLVKASIGGGIEEGSDSLDESIGGGNNNNSPNDPLDAENLDLPIDQAQNQNGQNGIMGDQLPELDSNEVVLYELFFRTSMYDNPQDKIDAYAFETMNNHSISSSLPMEPLGYEDLVGFYSFSPSLTIQADLQNTSWYEEVEQYMTHNGAINPYKTNSDREDYTIAIKDNLTEDRIEKYGDSQPDKAILFEQENLTERIVSLSNLDAINEANQQNEIHEALPLKLTYAVDSIVWEDIQYFINESLNQVDWEDLVLNLNIDMFDCDDIMDCCLNNSKVRDLLITDFTNQISLTNDITSGSYFINEDFENSCYNLIPTTILDNENKFLKHNMEKPALKNGNYPIYFNHSDPLSGESRNSILYNIQKNNGSED